MKRCVIAGLIGLTLVGCGSELNYITGSKPVEDVVPPTPSGAYCEYADNSAGDLDMAKLTLVSVEIKEEINQGVALLHDEVTGRNIPVWFDFGTADNWYHRVDLPTIEAISETLQTDVVVTAFREKGYVGEACYSHVAWSGLTFDEYVSGTNIGSIHDVNVGGLSYKNTTDLEITGSSVMGLYDKATESLAFFPTQTDAAAYNPDTIVTGEIVAVDPVVLSSHHEDGSITALPNNFVSELEMGVTVRATGYFNGSEFDLADLEWVKQ